MTKKLISPETPIQESRKFYRVKVRIQSDTLEREHKAGSIADLSDWPADVLETWTEQGVIEPYLEPEQAEEAGNG